MSAQSSSVRLEDELHNYLDKVDKKVKTQSSAKVDNLLYPSNELDAYYTLQRQLANNGKESKQNAAARIIQKTWRMYSRRRVFVTIFDNFISMKRNRLRAYFYVLLLNTNIKDGNYRLKAYQHMAKQFRIDRVFPKEFISVDFHTFRVTELAFIPKSMKPNVLCTFVKYVCRNLMKNVVWEWRVMISRRKQKEELARPDFNYGALVRLEQRPTYIAFVLWRTWTQNKYKNIKPRQSFPELDNYMKTLQAKQQKIDNADQTKLNFIKKNALQALITHMRESHIEQQNLLQSDAFRLRSIMKHGYKAWTTLINDNCQKIVLKHNIISHWRKYAVDSAYNKKLLALGKQRHDYFLKRKGLSVFIINLKAASVTRTYMACRVQEKPAQGYQLIYAFMNNRDEYLFITAFSEWSKYVKRRRMWHRFLFQNIKTSEYDVTKKKALAALRKKAPPYITPQQMTSNIFQQETMLMYDRVMKSPPNDKQIYLLMSDKDAKVAQRNASTARTKRDAREYFFQAWRMTKPNLALFMRIAVIILTKKKEESQPMSIAERNKKTFFKALFFLEQYNFASSSGLQALRITMRDNAKAAFSNRVRRQQRDEMIIKAHETRESAIAYSKIDPNFTVNEKNAYFDDVAKVTKNLHDHFRPIKALMEVCKIKGLKNDPNFAKLKGCKAYIPNISKRVYKLHNDHLARLERLNFTPQLPSFNAFRQTANSDRVSSNAKSNLAADMFTTNKVEASPLKPTFANKRLLQAIPKAGRKAKVIDHTTKTAFTLGHHEEEEEHEEDLANLSAMPSIASLSQNLNVSTFNFKDSISKFSSTLSLTSSSSSFASYASNMESIREDQEEKSERPYGDMSHVDAIDEITNEQGFLEEEELEYYSEYYEEEDKETGRHHHHRRHSLPAQEPIQLDSGEELIVHQNLDSIFSGTLTRQGSEKIDIKPTDVKKKYQQFIEILFGDPSALSDPNLDHLREALIQKAKQNDIKNLKTEINTKEFTMPIGNLATAFREDREIESEPEEEEAAEPPKTRESMRSTQSKHSTDSVKAEQNQKPILETQIQYGSRRYQKPMKRGKTRMSIGSTGKLTKSIESLETSSSGDEMLFAAPVRVIKLEEEEDQNESEKEKRKNLSEKEDSDEEYYESESDSIESKSVSSKSSKRKSISGKKKRAKKGKKTKSIKGSETGESAVDDSNKDKAKKKVKKKKRVIKTVAMKKRPKKKVSKEGAKSDGEIIEEKEKSEDSYEEVVDEATQEKVKRRKTAQSKKSKSSVKKKGKEKKVKVKKIKKKKVKKEGEEKELLNEKKKKKESISGETIENEDQKAKEEISDESYYEEEYEESYYEEEYEESYYYEEEENKDQENKDNISEKDKQSQGTNEEKIDNNLYSDSYYSSSSFSDGRHSDKSDYSDYYYSDYSPYYYSSSGYDEEGEKSVQSDKKSIASTIPSESGESLQSDHHVSEESKNASASTKSTSIFLDQLKRESQHRTISSSMEVFSAPHKRRRHRHHHRHRYSKSDQGQRYGNEDEYSGNFLSDGSYSQSIASSHHSRNLHSSSLEDISEEGPVSTSQSRRSRISGTGECRHSHKHDTSHSRRSRHSRHSLDSRHSMHSRHSRHSRHHRGSSPLKPQWDTKALDKVVNQYIEQSVTIHDLDNLVEIDPEEDWNEKRKSMNARPTNNTPGKRKPLYIPPEAPKQYQRKVYGKRSQPQKIEHETTVIEDQKVFTKSMENILNESKFLNQIIYNQGQTQIVSNKAMKNNKPLPPLKETNEVKKSQTSLDYLPFEGKWMTVPDPTQSSKSQLTNSPVDRFSRPGRVKNSNVAPQSISKLQHSQPLNTTYLGHSLVKQAGSHSPPPIKRPMVIKHNPISSPIKKDKTDYDQRALRQLVKQILDIIITATNGSEEMIRLQKRASMIRKRPAFIGLKAPEKYVSNQFYDRTQSILIRYTANQDVRAASDDLVSLFAESTDNSHILIEEVNKLMREEKELLKKQKNHTYVDPTTIDPTFAVHLMDLDWMSNLKHDSVSGVGVMYKRGRNKMSAILAPANSFDKKSKRKRQIRHYYVPPKPVKEENLTLDDLVFVSRYVPMSMINQVIDKYQGNNSDTKGNK